MLVQTDENHTKDLFSKSKTRSEAPGLYFAYRKIYFKTNKSARTYIKGEIFFALPVTTFKTT
jgi:hypothetical protein